MSGLNLFDTYDKSLADVNRDYIEEILLTNRVYRRKIESSKPITIAISIFLMIVSSVASIYYLWSTRVIPLKDVKRTMVDSTSFEEGLGYVRVQLFEFADNETIYETKTVEPKEVDKKSLIAGAPEAKKIADIPDKTSKRDTTYKNRFEQISSLKDENVGVPPSNLDEISEETYLSSRDSKIKDYDKVDGPELINAAIVAENKQIAANKKRRDDALRAKLLAEDLARPKPKLYTLSFENLTPQKIQKVSTVLSLNNIEPTPETRIVSTPIFRVYVEDADDGLFTIREILYRKLGEFDDHIDAKIYASKISEPTKIIVEEEIILTEQYNVTACCVDNLDLAKRIIGATKITDTTVKIILVK